MQIYINSTQVTANISANSTPANVDKNKIVYANSITSSNISASINNSAISTNIPVNTISQVNYTPEVLPGITLPTISVVVSGAGEEVLASGRDKFYRAKSYLSLLDFITLSVGFIRSPLSSRTAYATISNKSIGKNLVSLNTSTSVIIKGTSKILPTAAISSLSNFSSQTSYNRSLSSVDDAVDNILLLTNKNTSSSISSISLFSKLIGIEKTSTNTTTFSLSFGIEKSISFGITTNSITTISNNKNLNINTLSIDSVLLGPNKTLNSSILNIDNSNLLIDKGLSSTAATVSSNIKSISSVYTSTILPSSIIIKAFDKLGILSLYTPISILANSLDKYTDSQYFVVDSQSLNPTKILPFEVSAVSGIPTFILDVEKLSTVNSTSLASKSFSKPVTSSVVSIATVQAFFEIYTNASSLAVSLTSYSANANKHIVSTISNTDNVTSLTNYNREFLSFIISTDDYLGIANIDDDQYATVNKNIVDPINAIDIYSSSAVYNREFIFSALTQSTKQATTGKNTNSTANSSFSIVKTPNKQPISSATISEVKTAYKQDYFASLDYVEEGYVGQYFSL